MKLKEAKSNNSTHKDEKNNTDLASCVQHNIYRIPSEIPVHTTSIVCYLSVSSFFPLLLLHSFAIRLASCFVDVSHTKYNTIHESNFGKRAYLIYRAFTSCKYILWTECLLIWWLSSYCHQ